MKKTSLSIFLLLSIISVNACFWENDTVEMERQDFPNVIELISGKFIRITGDSPVMQKVL